MPTVLEKPRDIVAAVGTVQEHGVPLHPSSHSQGPEQADTPKQKPSNKGISKGISKGAKYRPTMQGVRPRLERRGKMVIRKVGLLLEHEIHAQHPGLGEVSKVALDWCQKSHELLQFKTSRHYSHINMLRALFKQGEIINHELHRICDETSDPKLKEAFTKARIFKGVDYPSCVRFTT